MASSTARQSRVVGPAQRPTKTRPDVTVGKLLAEARRRYNLTIAAVAEELCIPERQLRGLEDGDLTVFPAEVYARGAFTKYAAYLGVQAESTQRAFQRVLSGSREYVPLRVHRPKSWLAAHMTPRWVLAGVIGCIALLVGSYVAWQVISYVWLPALSVEALPGVTSATTVTVRGTAAADAVVFVNENQVLLDQTGTFSADLPLHRGVNVIQVTAQNAAGRSTHHHHDILVSAQ